MGSLAQSRPFTIAADPLSAIRSRFAAERADEDETAATIRTVQREAGILIDPHTAVALAVAEKENRERDRGMPMVVLSTAHPAKFPAAVEAACGIASRFARLARRSRRAPRTHHGVAERSGRGREIHHGGEPGRARRSCRMSMNVTRLPSGLAVVTDAMPHLQSASLGVWVRAGSRDERPDEHGISHFLEHMAFKGTTTPHRAADRRGDRGGRRRSQCSDQCGKHRLSTRACCAPTCRSHSMCSSDILSNPTFEPEELAREKNVIVQEIGATEDTPDDLIFEYLQGTHLSGSADRPLDPRHAGQRALDRRTPAARVSLAQLPRARHGDRGGRRGRA